MDTWRWNPFGRGLFLLWQAKVCHTFCEDSNLSMSICGSGVLCGRVAKIWWTSPLSLFLSTWENTHSQNDRLLMLSRVPPEYSALYIEPAHHGGTLEWVPAHQSLIYHFSHTAFRSSPTLITVNMIPVSVDVEAESTAALLHHCLCLTPAYRSCSRAAFQASACGLPVNVCVSIEKALMVSLNLSFSLCFSPQGGSIIFPDCKKSIIYWALSPS